MGINVGDAISESNKLENYYNSLAGIRSNLTNTMFELSSNWDAEEIYNVSQAFGSINDEISSLMNELDSLSNDIVDTAYEIKEEEDEEEAEEARESSEAEDDY